MKVAIIGTGNVGQALARSLAGAHHEVVIAGRDAAKAATTATALGVGSAADARAAAADAEVVILAVPFASSGEAVAREIGPVVGGTVVVDATNPLLPDYSGLATAGGPSAAEQFAAWLPDARVVKAFNTLFASNQGASADPDTRLDGLFATDDEDARDVASALLASIGLRPVHVGPLARARELEALAWLNISMQLVHGGDWRTSIVLVDPPAASTTARAA